MIISFYIYRKVRESFYLIEITAEIHVVNIFNLKILIAIDIVNTEKIFIDFRIRTLAINTIPEFSANIRTIHKNIKIIKIVRNGPSVTVYWLGGPSVSDVLQWDWIFVEARLKQ
jgi:hypothetical protein